MTMFAMCINTGFLIRTTWNLFWILFWKLSSFLNATILKEFRIFVIYWSVKPIIGDVMNSVTDIRDNTRKIFKKKCNKTRLRNEENC